MKASTRDHLGSALMLLFVASLYVQRSYITPFGGLFPDVIMYILVGIVAVNIALSFTKHAALQEKAKEGKFHWVGMIVVGGILLAWAVLLRYVGFIVAGIAGFTAICWYLMEPPRTLRKYVWGVAVAAGVVMLLVAVFQGLLKVPLPPGKLFE